MTAEIVFIIFKELDSEQKQRFQDMLEKEKMPPTKPKKKTKVWSEAEVTEKLILMFKNKVKLFLSFFKISF